MALLNDEYMKDRFQFQLTIIIVSVYNKGEQGNKDHKDICNMKQG